MKKAKLWFCVVCGALFAILGVLLLRGVPALPETWSVLPYLGIGIGCGAFGYGLGELLAAAAVKKDPDMAKQLEIEAKDERNVMLGNAAKAKGYNVMTYVFAALMLAFALMKASWMILIPLVIAYLFIQFYTVYCRIKMEKEL